MQAIINISLYKININEDKDENNEYNENNENNKNENNGDDKGKIDLLYIIIILVGVFIIILIAALYKCIYKLYKKKRNDTCIERIYLEINEGRSTL